MQSCAAQHKEKWDRVYLVGNLRNRTDCKKPTVVLPVCIELTRIQNTEYRIQNTEYRIQNTEYRI